MRLRLFRFVPLALALSFAYPAFEGRAQAPAAASSPDRRTAGAAPCRIETPAAWSAGHVTWLGGCKGGYADGLGVLRHIMEGVAVELFAGRVDRGTLGSGVLDTGQGYMAGHWQGGSLAEADTDDQSARNSLLAAFEDGAKAAEATAKLMARHSNPKSARFYGRLAKRLRAQMD